MGIAELSQRIAAISEEPGVLLFAGAGCSAALKIPVWNAYLEQLAVMADKHEPHLAALMRSRMRDDEYLKAATLFKRILQAPPSEKLRALCQPFDTTSYSVEPLLPLTSLPFSGIVTTNYDSSLYDARGTILARGSKKLPQVLRKQQAKGAAYIETPFVLYLHGQASLAVLAEEMVFDEEDYRVLYNDQRFTDGLLQLLSIRKCLFLGFSFADPGIDAILRTWTALKGPAFPQAHLAVLPESITQLRPRLTSMNVEVLTYDDSSGSHDVLWQAVRQAAHVTSGAVHTVFRFRARPAPRPAPLGAVRDLLAICYANATIGKGIRPLRLIVLEGVALAVISQHGPAGIDQDQLIQAMAQSLGMPPTELAPEMSGILGHLVEAGACQSEGGTLSSTEKVPDTLTDRTKLLAHHVAGRVKLREGVTVSQPAITSLAQAFEDLLMARAWDLAAHFVQPRTGGLHAIDEAVDGVLRAIEFPGQVNKDAVRRGMIDLLVRPDAGEADILADLGRVAFAVQLALGNARTTFAYTVALPQRLYFDASVLMPAIVSGHPLSPVYWPVLERLRQRALDAGGQVSIIAPMEFLNEIINHRRSAISIVKSGALEDPNNLEREVLLYQAENLNVFIGAYATHVGRGKRRMPFAVFLKQYAPYETEGDLEAYLARKGIEVERLGADGPRPTGMWEWYNALDIEYQQEEKDRPKPKVLIEHEAWQLLRLEADQRSGIRSMFVTADAKLRRAVATIKGGALADALLSGSALVKLVDLLLGIKVDHRGLARLLWGVHSVDLGGAVRRYFTDKGLQKRGEIETMVLPNVVERIVRDAEAAPEFSTLTFMSEEETERTKVMDFFDRFEDRFYEYLDAAVRARQAQETRTQAPAPIGTATPSNRRQQKLRKKKMFKRR